MALEPVRRVVTGHDETGRAVVVHEGQLEAVMTPAGASAMTLLWTTSGLPVDNDDSADGRERPVDLTNPGGTVLRVVDLMPGRSAPMHRTSSLDFGIAISGTIELVLDDDQVTVIRPGDVVVQRGTIHAWRNPSETEVARVAFVLLDASPVTVGGQPLPDIHPGGPRSSA